MFNSFQRLFWSPLKFHHHPAQWLSSPFCQSPPPVCFVYSPRNQQNKIQSNQFNNTPKHNNEDWVEWMTVWVWDVLRLLLLFVFRRNDESRQVYLNERNMAIKESQRIPNHHDPSVRHPHYEIHQNHDFENVSATDLFDRKRPWTRSKKLFLDIRLVVQRSSINSSLSRHISHIILRNHMMHSRPVRSHQV